MPTTTLIIVVAIILFLLLALVGFFWNQSQSQSQNQQINDSSADPLDAPTADAEPELDLDLEPEPAPAPVPELEDDSFEADTVANTPADRSAFGNNDMDGNFVSIDTFFGTDRKDTNSHKAYERFSGERGEGISYGICKVSIPKQHQVGEVERPLWGLRYLENEKKHVLLRSINSLSATDFFAELRIRMLGQLSSALVFVHGYNVSFEAAAMRTAQMAYDLKFNGLPCFYSWPSDGRLTSYNKDEADIKWTEPNMYRFLVDFFEKSSVDQVYLIGHSMGTRALSRVVGKLLNEHPQYKDRLQEVILAAPDIDADIFKRDIAPVITNAGQTITLYTSNNDLPLVASAKIHGQSRAGFAGKNMVVQKGIETIDASTAGEDLLKHSYVGDSRSILSDLYYLLRGLRPDERFDLAKRKHDSGGEYWEVRG